MTRISGFDGNFTQLTKLNVTEQLLEDGNPVLAGDTSLLVDGTVPQAVGGILTSAGISVDQTTGVVTFDNTIVVPSGSIVIGEVLQITEGIADLVVVNLIEDSMAFSVNSPFDDLTGSSIPKYTDFGSPEVLEINTDDSENLTDNPLTFSLIGTVVAPDKRLIDQITFRGGSAMTNFRVSVTDNATGLVIRYIPSKAAFEGSEDGLDTIVGDNTLFFSSNAADTPGNFNLGFIPFIIEENQLIDFIVIADSVDMLGNLSGVPFLVAEAHDGPDVDVLTSTEAFVDGLITFSDGSTSVTGSTRSSDDWHVAASIVKQSFSTATEDNEPEGIFFRADGLKMYLVGSENGLVYEYDLSTSWDVSTSVFLQSFDPSITNINGIWFRPNGLQMFLLDITIDAVKEYKLTTAFDISTASFQQSFDLGAAGGGTLPHDLYFKNDGKKFYVAEIFDQDVEQYDMTRAWDISTATLTTQFATGITDFAVTFKLDGTVMYVIDGSGVISEFNLTTAWLIDTAELVNTFDASLTSVRGLFFKSDGAKLYITEESNDTVIEYNVGLDISAPLNIRIPLNGDTVGINFVNETNFNAATIQYNDSTLSLALSSTEMSLTAGDTLSLTSDEMILDTTGDITINSNIFINNIGQTIIMQSVGGTGTPNIDIRDSSNANKLLIEYDEQINNINITGTVDTTIDTTSGSTFLHSAANVSLDARSGSITLESTSNIIFNDLIDIDEFGQTITLTSENVSGTPSIEFDDSLNVLGASIVFDETDDDLTITAVLGDLQLISTSSDIEILPGSGFTSVNFSNAISTLHVFEDTATTGSETGVTIEQDGLGDALIHFTLTGLQDWTLGVDNSISDGFAINPSTSLGTDPVFFIETGGDIGFGTSNPSCNLDISDLGGDLVAIQLTGDDGSFRATVSGNGQTTLQSTKTTGVINYGFQGLPLDGTSNVRFRFGINSGSTGSQLIELFEPNGSVVQTQIATSGLDTFFNAIGGMFGVGLTAPTSTHHVEGSVAKSIVAKTAAYTLTVLDYTVTGDATSAAFTFSLPTAVGIDGRIYVLKKTDSSVNIVTVDASGSQTIDGALTFDLTDENESITIQSDNANWVII